MKSLALCALLLSFLPAVALADPLGDLVKGESFWVEGSGESFMQEYQSLGFRWTSEAKDSARSISGDLTVEGRKVGESIVYFAEGKPCLLYTSPSPRD